MLTNEELEKIRAKMKATHTFGATFARRWGVTRQAINYVLNKKCQSENLENKIREWANE
jgi:hypothetical protein